MRRLLVALLCFGTNAYAELHAGDKVIVSNAYTTTNGLAPGLWSVTAVGADGSIVITARTSERGRPDSKQYIVDKNSYVAVVRSDLTKVIVSNAYTSENGLASGLWSVTAVGADGSIVITARTSERGRPDNKQYIVDKNSYVEVVKSDLTKVIVSDAYTRANRIASGLWSVTAVGADGSIVITARTSERGRPDNKQYIVDKNSYVVLRGCHLISAEYSALEHAYVPARY